MKKTLLLILSAFWLNLAVAQPPITFVEKKYVSEKEQPSFSFKKDIFTLPPNVPVRTLAEWEELEAIALTYDIEFSEHKKRLIAEIALHAKEEVKVLIFCGGAKNDLIEAVKSQLRRRGVVNQDNLFFIKKDFNERIWIRDFGAHTVYENEVGKRILVDWLYDPSYENADVLVSGETSNFLGTDLYTTTTDPYKLRLDGGNLQSDGLGMGIVSTHIFDDNLDYSEPQLDAVTEQFMGIDNLIKLEKLPFDVIHHVDMHLKLLDEETLLVGQYPDSIADGPQIEANLKYLTENFKTSFGTDFKIKRIEMPADRGGKYPDEISGCSERGRGCYYTYTNAFFINELVLVPTYFGGQGADIEALNQWKEMMPGYEIVGINCDSIIKEYGAIHCVTKEIGVKNPLRIIHQKLDEVCQDSDSIQFSATIQHISGIESATVFYSTDPSAGFQQKTMDFFVGEIWETKIANFPKGTKVTYFIRASAENGKTIARPMPAEKGGWTFEVDCKSSSVVDQNITDFGLQVFPNPVSDNFKIFSPEGANFLGNLLIFNGLGQVLKKEKIQTPVEVSTEEWESGVYFLRFEKDGKFSSMRIVK